MALSQVIHLKHSHPVRGLSSLKQQVGSWQIVLGSQLNQVVLSCVCFLMLVSNLRTSLMAMVA